MKRSLLLIPLLAAFCLGASQDKKPLQIIWVDVEGGAATLIVAPSGESLLMDAGWPGKRDAERIAKAAAAAGLKKIDHFLVSHFHTDHWGGVPDLAQAFPIGKYYDHGFPDASAKDVDPKIKEAYLKATGGNQVILKPGDTIPLGEAQVKILTAHGIVLGEEPGSPQSRRCQANPEHPARPDDTSDNARSLGFLVTFGGFKFLNMGDLTWNVEHKIVCPQNLIGTVDVYQATHHGHDQSNNPALLKAVQPLVVVINNGAKKGGTAPTFRWLKETTSIKDIFQVHRNVATGPADNAPPEFVANDGEKCEGEGIRLVVDPDGKNYTVEVPSKKTKKSYAVK